MPTALSLLLSTILACSTDSATAGIVARLSTSGNRDFRVDGRPMPCTGNERFLAAKERVCPSHNVHWNSLRVARGHPVVVAVCQLGLGNF